MKFNSVHIRLVLFLSLIICVPKSFGISLSKDDSLGNKVKKLSENTIEIFTEDVTLAKKEFDFFLVGTRKELKSYTDSIISYLADSISKKGKEKISDKAKLLDEVIVKLGGIDKYEIDSLRKIFNLKINALSEYYRKNDVFGSVDSLLVFETSLKSFSSEYYEMLVIMIEQKSNDIVDNFELIAEDFDDFIQDVVNGELGITDEVADILSGEKSSLFLSLSGSNHDSYRARDAGYRSMVSSVSLTYTHFYGFGVALYGTYHYEPDNAWDAGGFALFYKTYINKNFLFDVSYSKSFYADSTGSIKSAYASSFDGGVSFNSEDLYASLRGTLDIGTKIDPTITLGVGYNYQISPENWLSTITISPLFNAIYGTQSLENIIVSRNNFGKHQTITYTSVTKDVFAIMGYEFTLPLFYETGIVSISPFLQYSIPINVTDDSNTSPFVKFGIDISFSLR